MISMPTLSKKEVVRVAPAIRIMLTAIFVLSFFGLFAPAAMSASGHPAATIYDIENHWAAAEIEGALSLGYVQGYPDGSFRPDAGVTRAEFVSMLVGAFQVPPAPDQPTPGDVLPGDWYAKDVASAIASGFVTGYPDGTFRPEWSVDRQEAACMLARLSKPDGGGSPDFTDNADIDDWAMPSVSSLVNAGILSGYPDGSFRPQRIINRAEAVVLINRALSSLTLTPVSGKLQVTSDAVNVRSGPSTASSILGQANSGDILQAKAKNEDSWYQIDYQGTNAWIAGWYTEACQPPPGAQTEPDPSDSGTSATATAPSQGDSNVTGTPATPSRGNSGTFAFHAGQDDTGTAGAQNTSDITVTYNDSGQHPHADESQVTPDNSAPSGSNVQVLHTDVSQGTTGITTGSGSGAGNNQPAPPIQEKAQAGSPAQGSSASFFYGMDLAAYPGDDVMQAWWNNSPFYYTGFYLGPAPYHPDTSFMDKRQTLINQGWGLMPIYVGCQADSNYLDSTDGRMDGDDAATLTSGAGFPSGTTIFLDIETSDPLTDAFLDYVTAWAGEIEADGYNAGVYCYVGNASQIRSALPGNVEFWVAYYTGSGFPPSTPSPTDSGISFADAWQFVGDTDLTYGGYPLSIDFNTSAYTDPSTESKKINK